MPTATEEGRSDAQQSPQIEVSVNLDVDADGLRIASATTFSLRSPLRTGEQAGDNASGHRMARNRLPS